MWVRISTILREAAISFKTEFQWQTDINQFNQHVQEKTLPTLHFLCVYPSTVAVRLIYGLSFPLFLLAGLGNRSSITRMLCPRGSACEIPAD